MAVLSAVLTAKFVVVRKVVQLANFSVISMVDMTERLKVDEKVDWKEI